MTDYQKSVANVRAEIIQKKQDIQALNSAVVPLAIARARIDARIEELAGQVHFVASDFAYPDGRTRVRFEDPVDSGPDGALAILCRVSPDAVRTALMADVEAFYESETVFVDEGKKAQLEKDVRALEVKEEDLISKAAALGIRIVRRPDADPAVVLGT